MCCKLDTGELRKEIIGMVVKHASMITSEEEDTLWKTNALGEALL